MQAQTFQQALGQCGSDQRAQVEHLWLVHASAEPDQERRTLLVMKRTHSLIVARFAWERLSTQERQILFPVLKGQDGGIPRETLLKKIRLETVEIQAALARLRQLLLLREVMAYRPTPARRRARIIFAEEEQIQQEEVLHVSPYPELSESLYAVGREQFAPGADRSQFPLSRIIRDTSHSALYMIAQHHRIDLSSSYGATAQRTLIIEELSHPDTVLQTVSLLQEQLQKVFHWLVERGGSVTVQALRQFVGTHDDATLLALVQTLGDYALAFNTLNAAGEHVLFIPQQVYKPLSEYGSRPNAAETEYSLLPLAAPPATRMGSMPIVLFDVAAALSATYQQSIEPTKDGSIPKRIVAKLRPFLQGAPRRGELQEDIYPDMLFEMARALKLLQTSRPSEGGDKPSYQPGPALPDWAALSVIAQGRRILDWWMSNSRWRDGWEHTFGQWSTFWNPLGARKLLITYLKRCTPGRWYSIAGLLETIWKEEPFALHSSRAVSSPVRLPPSHSQRTVWYKREALVYGGSLSTLYELGIIDLGQRSASGSHGAIESPDAFSLTSLGHAIIEHTNTARSLSAKTSSDRVVVVQPSFELIVLEFDPPSLYTLLPFAQVVHVSLVSRLKMTRDSVIRGVSCCLDSEQILAQLTSVSKTDIPQNVDYSVREWARGYRAITFTQVILLEVSGGEELALNLDQHPQLAPFGLRLLGSRVLAAPNHANLPNLRRVLKDMGIITRIAGDIITRTK